MRGWTYILDNMIQVENVIGEALVLPSGAGIFVGECVAVVHHGRVLNDVVEHPQLSEHVCAQHITIAILSCHNYSAKPSCLREINIK